MDIKELNDKSNKQAEKFASKYSRKLTVVETSIDMSPEEKIAVYKKLLKKLKRAKMVLNFKTKYRITKPFCLFS